MAGEPGSGNWGSWLYGSCREPASGLGACCAIAFTIPNEISSDRMLRCRVNEPTYFKQAFWCLLMPVL